MSAGGGKVTQPTNLDLLNLVHKKKRPRRWKKAVQRSFGIFERRRLAADENDFWKIHDNRLEFHNIVSVLLLLLPNRFLFVVCTLELSRRPRPFSCFFILPVPPPSRGREREKKKRRVWGLFYRRLARSPTSTVVRHSSKHRSLQNYIQLFSVCVVELSWCDTNWNTSSIFDFELGRNKKSCRRNNVRVFRDWGELSRPRFFFNQTVIRSRVENISLWMSD